MRRSSPSAAVAAAGSAPAPAEPAIVDASIPPPQTCKSMLARSSGLRDGSKVHNGQTAREFDEGV
jgi:hypothetical protein